MNVLEHLEPKSVFRFFEEMCAIPHGSRNTKAVSDWCADFARARGLEYHQDGDNNIIIIKEAAPGYEAAPPVILQGHLDMVCEQTADCQKDMSREGLDLAVDGDFVYAKGTTLGGDDGIAVAMALALLDAEGLPHPRLEAVFTVDEEIGLLGAASIDVTPLKGRQMLNLDSEAEGIFTVSCAGGNTSACLLPLTRAPSKGARQRQCAHGPDPPGGGPADGAAAAAGGRRPEGQRHPRGLHRPGRGGGSPGGVGRRPGDGGHAAQ